MFTKLTKLQALFLVIRLRFFLFLNKKQNFKKITPSIVENADATSEGNIISVEFKEPLATLIPIIVVGISCKLVAFITKSISIALVVLPVCLSIELIAYIALGVAALPIPKRLNEMFMLTNCFDLFSILPNKKSMTGESKFDIFFDKLVFSTISISPSQIAYMASNLIDKVTALVDAVIKDETTDSGSVNIKSIIDTIIINSQILFIQYLSTIL